ncbi:MAG: YeiH family protein [Saprospiraceae bacterium]|nr:YeiH family protein [Saprospiraceae bacterium]
MTSRAEFTKTEDFWALAIGGLLLMSAILLLSLTYGRSLSADLDTAEEELQREDAGTPFHSVQWYEALDRMKEMDAGRTRIGKLLKTLTDKPGKWKADPLQAFHMSEQSVEAIRLSVTEDYEFYRTREEALHSAAIASQQDAANSNYDDSTLNDQATAAISAWRTVLSEGQGISKSYNSKPFSKWLGLASLFILLALLFGAGSKSQGFTIGSFVKGFVFVFMLGVLSFTLAGQSSMTKIGFGYAAWAILIGLFISNTVGTPSWVKSALRTEFFIKTGLVVLGAEILFGKILAIGLPGIFVAWVVTPIVLISTYWFGQKIIKIPSKTLNITVSADMSVCGVSAAVATAAACKASKEELTLAVGLSMIFTSIMMIVLPMVINTLGLPEVLGGAWIGGTIDATGAVVAAGAFLGDTALNVAATIKMIQNILIGVIAFGVAVYFARSEGAGGGAQVGWSEIWIRFPKFILGFIGASILFSLLYMLMGEDLGYALIDQGVIKSFSSRLRGWLFCLAFVSIGLSTNFKELKRHFSGGKPLILYVCGQTLNLALTLAMAYIMFYLVFPQITENI